VSGGARDGDDPRRDLPGVDRLLEEAGTAAWIERWGRGPVVRALRDALAEARRVLAGEPDATEAAEPGSLLSRVRRLLEVRDRPSLRPVLNATGVVLHTNLGRAPLAPAAIEAVARVGPAYSNLEYDLGEGARGSRYEHCTDLLRELTGAEAALVVNNNAAAVALVVNELASDREVVVSRGELVEIGGSFRIPDIVARAGARLREVGTTNRTRLEDYRAALGEGTGLFLKVHPSNYRVEGFVESVELEALAGLGREHGVPVVHDLGSGLLSPDLLPGFPPEPSPAGSLAAGADLVTWSGDKLLGGPQAGVLAGRREVVTRLRGNPLLRAFRVDKATLAALEATLRLYRDPELAAREVPAIRMLREPAASVEGRARAALQGLEAPSGIGVEVRELRSVVGGGSFPGFDFPSAGWAVTGTAADLLDAACRAGDPPLVGRIAGDAFLLDFRTLLPGQEEQARDVLASALGKAGPAAPDAGAPGGGER